MKFIKLVRYQKQFPDGVSDMSPGFAVLQPVSLGLAVKLGPDGECLVQAVDTPDQEHGDHDDDADLPGGVEDEEGDSSEDQDDGKIVFLALTLLHCLLSSENSSLTSNCRSVQTRNCPRIIKWKGWPHFSH